MSGFFILININMSNAFTNFLGSVASGIFGSNADLKDYQHADRLFVKNTYARAPKFGFLFFVVFDINRNAVRDTQWLNRGIKDVGLLVKKVDLPKFLIQTETLNQYNRRTAVHTKLTYSTVVLEFHDDNSDITTDLWKNYYQYYFTDSVFGEVSGGKSKPPQYEDTKYGDKDYPYGFDNYQNQPFFNKIDIYVLHKGKGPQDFTQVTLLNPKISEWTHDQLNSEDSGKPLTNRMNIVYEAVNYRKGKIVKNSDPVGFTPIYYDTAPSPLSVSGGIPGTLFGDNGIISGASQIFGENGTFSRALQSGNPLDLLGVALQSRNLAQGVRNISRSGLATEGYSILNSALSGMATAGRSQLSQPDGVSQAVQSGLQQSGFGTLGNVGVNIFAHKNNSINQLTVAKPSNLTGGGP
jgi:hypothetical protein